MIGPVKEGLGGESIGIIGMNWESLSSGKNLLQGKKQLKLDRVKDYLLGIFFFFNTT